MDIILKGLTAEQAKHLVDYFEHNLYQDSSVWIEEYCYDINGIDVQSIDYMYRTNLVEVKLKTHR
jgi:hypothetical protein